MYNLLQFAQFFAHFRDYILMRGKLSSPELEVDALDTWERGSTWELDLNQNPAEAERVCQQTTNCVGLAQVRSKQGIF